jgi:putative endonuclease
MTNFATGRQAEAAAADYLCGLGYEIIDQNWRTPVCEIDLVARKKKAVYFVEVKYRLSIEQGEGLEYITGKKLNQMKFAAEVWVTENDWQHDYCLAAVEVGGPEFEITEFLDSIT